MSYRNTSENTFFNTSLDVLSHHGVKGMKWGEWNDETKRKYFGGNGRRGIDSKLSNKNLDVKTSDYTDAAKSMRADLKAANLGGKLVSYFKKDRSINTGYCTAAYLLRKSGYDVAAKTSAVSLDPNDIAKLYKNIKTDISIKDGEASGYKISKEQIDKVRKELLKQGENASGFVIGTYAKSKIDGTKNGRVLAYTIANGKVNFIDGQTGKIYSDAMLHLGVSQFGDLKTIRTDNKSVNEKIAQHYVGSRELLKITDNKIDKVKVALTSAQVIGASMFAGGAIANSVVNVPLKNMYEGNRTIANIAYGVNTIINEGQTTVSKKALSMLVGALMPRGFKHGKMIWDTERALGNNVDLITDRSEFNVSKAMRDIFENRDRLTTISNHFADKVRRNNNLRAGALRDQVAESDRMIAGVGLMAAATLAVPVSKLMSQNINKIRRKDSNTISDKAYEKAARNYLKEHPNSTMSVSELAAKYKKEWTEGN